MPPVASGSGAAAGLGQVIGRLPRRRPIATISVLALTVVPTVLQFPFPAVRLALWRDPDALAAGQWWRLVTALFVQNDRWWQIVIVLACIAGIGVLAERLFGPPGGHLRHRGPSGPVGDAGWPLQRAGLDRGGPEPAAWVGPRLLPTQQAQGRVGHTGLRGAHHDREPPNSPSNATGARLAAPPPPGPRSRWASRSPSSPPRRPAGSPATSTPRPPQAPAAATRPRLLQRRLQADSAQHIQWSDEAGGDDEDTA
jgi:hypothetical protein